MEQEKESKSKTREELWVAEVGGVKYGVYMEEVSW